MTIHECEQGSEQWERLRAGKITASKVGSIITAVKMELSKGANTYINELIGACACPEWRSFQGNFATERGTEMEPIARQEFSEATGHDIHQVGFITMDDPAHPHSWGIGCSPDGLIMDGAGEWVAGLEIKCPYPATHVGYIRDAVEARKAATSTGPASDAWRLSLGLPDDYKQQVHASLAITGLPEWHFWSYFPGMQPLHVIVKPDAYTAKLKAAILAFANTYAAALADATKHIVPQSN